MIGFYRVNAVRSIAPPAAFVTDKVRRDQPGFATINLPAV
jgi:hypothetical protein